MTISIWRYSHLALAVSSFLFIGLAAATGMILSAEPVSQKIQPYRSERFDTITAAHLVTALKQQNFEVIAVEIDPNQFVTAKIIDHSGKNKDVYINPENGKPIGLVAKKSAFFEWVKNLHRSLFLHETGRFLMGLASFFLLLIATSGTVLVVKRQRGVKRFFTKVVKENFSQYYHVVLGRLSLVFILIVALSGTYLSLVRFKVFNEQKISHNIDFDSIKADPKIKISDFQVFKNMPLFDVKSIEFPFSDDPEDYFTIKLSGKEIVVNQFTSETLSEVVYSKSDRLSALSLDLHTGRASAIWASILAIAAANILFFIYSGFVIMMKRRSNKIRNKFSKEKAEYIILAGSENGSTLHFANGVYKQLLQNGRKVYVGELNDYCVFPSAKHLIVITATYGLGNPPANAGKFIKLLQKIPQQQPVFFSVLGFGSHAYKDFCKFAFEANNAILLQKWAVPFLEMHTVNDKSRGDLQKWASGWSQKAAIPFGDISEIMPAKLPKKHTLCVIQKTPVAHEDGAFLIRLKFKKNIKFASGDLLAVYPANDHRERQYSIGNIDGEIQLSVKLHPEGLGSNYLYNQIPGGVFEAAIVRNPHFYFPRKAPSVIMVSNGTGIAPFLGMIHKNNLNTNCHLYCGFRVTSSYEMYRRSIEASLENNKLRQLHLAYSREGARQYVKDLLLQDASFIAHTLKSGGVIMICGSLAMQQNVTGLLENICMEYHLKPLVFYQSRNQLLADCY